jgi:hypothetical protein
MALGFVDKTVINTVNEYRMEPLSFAANSSHAEESFESHLADYALFLYSPVKYTSKRSKR